MALLTEANIDMPQTETSEGPQFQLAGQWVAVAQVEKARPRRSGAGRLRCRD